MNDDYEPVGAEMPARENAAEYHTKVMMFAGKMLPAFLKAAHESAKRQGMDEDVEAFAKKTGRDPNELRQMAGIDGKFAVLSAMGVASNILAMIPDEMRGRLLGECIDFLALNSGISEERIKTVLLNSVMTLGGETERIIVPTVTSTVEF